MVLIIDNFRFTRSSTFSASHPQFLVQRYATMSNSAVKRALGTEQMNDRETEFVISNNIYSSQIFLVKYRPMIV